MGKVRSREQALRKKLGEIPQGQLSSHFAPLPPRPGGRPPRRTGSPRDEAFLGIELVIPGHFTHSRVGQNLEDDFLEALRQ